jgi:prefoldin subunit 5
MSDTNIPLAEENEHVKELAEILSKNGLGEDAKGLVEVFNHICKMEKDLSAAIGELTALRRELLDMWEEQKHPIKNMLHRAVDSLMARLKELYKQILSLKDKFVDGCRQAVEEIKDKGIVAANGIVGAIGVKYDLEESRNRMNSLISTYENRIDKIDAAAKEYNTAGHAIRNFGRVLVGREPIQEIKPNGKLAQLLQAPLHSEIRSLKRSLERTDKALARIKKLEKAAEQRTEHDKPSVVNEIKQHREATANTKPEIAAPAKAKVKTAGHEI